MPLDGGKTTSEYERVVAAGMKLLDEKCPQWRAKTNPALLNLGSSLDCVLAQIFGTYHNGLQELGLDTNGAVAYGFCTESETRDSFALLTLAWQSALSAP